MLEVENLQVAFATEAGMRTCVHGVSFSLQAGEVLGLAGESGSGKSVTSLAILRLLGPNVQLSGQIRFAGQNLLQLPEAAMRKHRGSSIAMIFQEPMTALNPVMTIGEQIAESVRAHQPELGSREIRERVVEAMNQVALPNSAQRYYDYPHQFSGGQRQRILIAMAIVNRPRLLIADEPTTALDVTVQAQILDLLAELRERHKLAMIFISHDLAVVSHTADRVAVMRQGEIIEMGTCQQVFGSPQHAYTKGLLAAVPTMRSDRTRPLAQVAVDSPAISI
ncbi:MAG: ATP-binding cassette domain-containing protein [Acidobacteriaceae bacterium]